MCCKYIITKIVSFKHTLQTIFFLVTLLANKTIVEVIMALER